jgi:hypothetical protein
MRCGVDPTREKALDFALLFVKDPERRVMRARQLACDLQQLREQRVEIELGYQGPADRDQSV